MASVKAGRIRFDRGEGAIVEVNENNGERRSDGEGSEGPTQRTLPPRLEDVAFPAAAKPTPRRKFGPDIHERWKGKTVTGRISRHETAAVGVSQSERRGRVGVSRSVDGAHRGAFEELR